MKTRNQFSLLLLIVLFLINFKSEAQEGYSCDEAIELSIDTELELTFEEDQEELYLTFNASDDSLMIELTPSSNTPLAEIIKVELYELEDCENLNLFYAYEPNDSMQNFFIWSTLTVNDDYLLVLYRDEEQLPEAYIDIELSQFISITCPNYNLSCGELIRNGGFEDVSSNPSSFNVFTSSNPANVQNSSVCLWENSFGTPDHHFNNNNNFVNMLSWDGNLSCVNKKLEGITQKVNLKKDTSYFLSFDISKNNNLPTTNFKVVLVDSLFVDSILQYTVSNYYLRSECNFLTNIKYKEEVVSLSTSTISTSFSTKVFCFTPQNNYSSIIFYLDAPNSSPGNNSWTAQLDNVSLKKFTKLDDLTDIKFDNCEVTSKLIGPTCEFEGATYSWSPTTGLDDPNIKNPTYTIPSTPVDFFVLTISTPGVGGCSISDTVFIDYERSEPIDYIIADGRNGDWLYNNVTQVLGVSDKYDGHTYLVEGDFFIDSSSTSTVWFENSHFYMKENARMFVDYVELKLTNSIVESCVEGEYWDSIAVSGTNSGSIDASLTTIQEGNKAISLTEGAEANIEVNFDLNKISIHVNDDASNNNLVTIDNSTFECSEPHDPDGTPYYSSAAIVINNWLSTSNLTIDNSTITASGGPITIENSIVDIDNSTFKEFNNQFVDIDEPTRADKAIRIFGSTSGSGSTVAIENSNFLLNEISIQSLDNNDLYIYKNKVNYDGTDYYTMINESIFTTVRDNTTETDVIDNDVFNVKYGVFVANSSDVDISDNEFDMEYQTVTGYTQKNNKASVGIWINNLSLSSVNYSNPPTVSIDNNTITHSKVGVLSEFAYSEIVNNDILDMNNNMTAPFPCGGMIFPPCAATVGYGIRAMNDVVDVQQNKVENNSTLYTTQPSTDLDIIGISLENTANLSASTNLYCNKVKNTGVGLKFSGNCGTNADILNNHMETHKRGFILTNSGNIGDVGSIGAAAKNTWQGSFTGGSHTFNYSYATNPKHYVLSGVGPSILATDRSPGFLAMTTSTTSPGNLINCTTPTLQRYNNGKVRASLTLKSGNSRSNFKFNRGQVNDSAFVLNSQLIYLQLIKDSIKYNDIAWKQYRDSVNNTPLGKMYKKNNIRGFSSLNNQDQLLLQIDDIVDQLDSINILDSSKIQSLNNIAKKCPYYDGVAVYLARSILSNFGFSLIVNDCEKVSRSGFQNQKRLRAFENDRLLIYPNPAKESINFNFEIEESDVVYFELHDVLGKMVRRKRLVDQQIHSVEFNGMHQGMYFYRLVKENEILESGKLIIE